jgi:DNA-binding ferritin-like protein
MNTGAQAIEALQWLLACLRAQYWSYQQSHWQTAGDAYYANHLLFQRLYESVVDQVDTLAEKMVGTFGPTAVDGVALAAKFNWWVRFWSEIPDHHERGLQSERGMQKCCRDTYNLLKSLDRLSLGLDDFLMATASEHETNQYLLGQVVRPDVAAEGE